MACNQIQKVSDVITNPSAREVFERDLKEVDSLFKTYEARYNKTKNNNLELDLPVTITSKSDSVKIPILSYKIKLKRGERLIIESPTLSDSLQLVMDVYAIKNDSIVREPAMVSNQPKENYLEMDVVRDGNYKVVVFPENKASINFNLKIYTVPTFIFPVSGKGNSAIQSFWGAPRGGGTRTHKGVDIFARRGTPVLAATDGYITNTGNRGLGGKQVWMRDGVFGQSLYYAHLDSIVVSGGQRVKTGDTLGLVGNTGNAKTTSPHLHFGIYTSRGAIDPLPFVEKTMVPNSEQILNFRMAQTRLNINQLRIGPAVKNSKIADLNRGTTSIILAKTEQWFHLRVNDSTEGFMHESLISKMN